MSDLEDSSRKQLLTGKDTWLGWVKVIKARMRSRGILIPSPRTNTSNTRPSSRLRSGSLDDNQVTEQNPTGTIEYIFEPSKMTEARNMIFTSVTLNIAGDIPDELDAEEILEWLDERFGDENKWELERDFKSLQMNGIDPKPFIASIDRFLARIKAAEGGVEFSEIFKIMMNGCHQEFYSDLIRQCRTIYSKDITPHILKDVRTRMKEYYANSSEVSKSKYSTKTNQFAGVATPKTRHCTICEKNGETRRMRSHDTEYHRDDYQKRENKSNNSQYFEDSPFYLDTGATQHFSPIKPRKSYTTKEGYVQTADKFSSPVPIVGEGDEQVHNLTLKSVQHVPKFGRSLVSGPALLQEGYKIEMEGNSFQIKLKNEVVAGGRLTHENLLRFGSLTDTKRATYQEIKQTSLSCTSCNKYDHLHRTLGHISECKVKETIKANNMATVPACGCQKKGCKTCLLMKTKKQNYPKTRSSHRIPRTPLDRIAIDIQGPFPFDDIEGCRSNVKMVDVKTGFVVTRLIPNKLSSTITNCFDEFRKGLEKKTGHKICFMERDPGTEFDGEMNTYCLDNGITQVIGDAKDHIFPAAAERAHETILRMGRAMLADSNLPRMYYGMALLFATYIYNRTPHGDRETTPFEAIYNQKPDMSKLKPFGCVCYAYIPKENRNKLNTERRECRLIGYGDYEGLVQRNGFRLLPVDPIYKGQDFYSRDVIFEMNEPREPLAGYTPITPNNDWFDPNRDDQNHTYNYDEDELDITDDEYDTLDNSSVYTDVPEATDTSSDISNHAFSLCLSTVEITDTPSSLKEAMESSEWKQWKAAMDSEVNSLIEAKTFHVKEPGNDIRPIKNKWVFTKKLDKDGNVKKFKARLVA